MKNLFLFSTLFLFVLFSCKKDEVVIPTSKIINDLSELAINSLALDNTNTLWIASDSGLYKSEESGYKLIELGISSPMTCLAFEEKNNTLWIGTLEGIYQFILDNNNIVASPVSIDHLSHINILSAYIDPNATLWFGTENGFSKNTGDNWQKDNFKLNLNGKVSDLNFEYSPVNSIGSWDGDYYFATSGNKLWRASNWDASVDAFTGASMWDPPYNGFAITDTMYAVLIDSKGQQWFGGKEGVQVHIGHDPKTDNTSYYDELVNPVVHCIAESAKGTIWVGTENGISIFDGENWSKLSTSLPNNFVTAITFEGDNIVWVGTKKGLVEISY